MATDPSETPVVSMTPAQARDAKLKHSDRQTLINLLLALGACIAIVVVVVMASPGQRKPIERNVDVAAALTSAQQATSMQLVNPLQPGWTANEARWTPGSSTSVPSWYVSMITNAKNAGTHRYMGMTQTDKPNPTWLAALLNAQAQTSTQQIAGTKVDVYDHRADDGGGTGTGDPTKEYALVVPLADSTVVLYGSASTETFTRVATSIIASSGAGK